DPHQPRGRRSQRDIVGFGSRPDEHEDFLQDFFGLAAVAQDSQDQAEQQPVMPIVELGDRLLVPRDDPVQERDIRAGIVGVLHVSTQPALEAYRLFYPYSAGSPPRARARTASACRDRSRAAPARPGNRTVPPRSSPTALRRRPAS